MSQRVELPKGCYGLDVPGGGKYNATRSGGSVTVSDRDAAKIKKANGQSGMLSAGTALTIGTRTGKRCNDDNDRGCGFLAQGWSISCPRCGSTVTEE